jgi:hypothetical protein
MFDWFLNIFRKQKGMPNPLQPIYDYFRHYDKGSYAIFACQGNEPTEDDVCAFERDIGFRLPDDFREFTKSPLGGLYMEVHEALWPRPKLYEVGPFWSFLYGIKVFGLARNTPEWLDMRHQRKQFADSGTTDLVPFLQICGDADPYCFDRDGRILRWRHETPDDRNREKLSFAELLMQEIHELEARKERKLRDEDPPKA